MQTTFLGGSVRGLAPACGYYGNRIRTLLQLDTPGILFWSPDDSDEELEVDRCFFKTISANAIGVPVVVAVVLLEASSPSAIFCPAMFVFDKN